MKVVISVVALILVLVILAGIVTLAIGTIRYMTDQKFNFGQAVEWAWNDLMDWFHDTFKIGEESEPEIIEYGSTNENIQVIGCIDLW